ncbi:MAG: hypothetical protein M1838_004546 [Thelocarpon superellum]|nr:MAG: hypothetical protein M1838_004546 [Thelocarpon superellum]
MEPIFEADTMAPPASLFQVYLRLKPPPTNNDHPNAAAAGPNILYPDLSLSRRYLTVAPPAPDADSQDPTHITLTPPQDSRRRAVEKFAFTRVFQEDAAQLDIFKGAQVLPLIEGVLGAGGKTERDGLLATLGVTGSGKSHTVLGSKTQRGMTQLSLDVLFRSLHGRLIDPHPHAGSLASLSASDASEAQMCWAPDFLEGCYGDAGSECSSLRAPTPMSVGHHVPSPSSSIALYPSRLGLHAGHSPPGRRDHTWTAALLHASHFSKNLAKFRSAPVKDIAATPTRARHPKPPRPSALPQVPDVSDIQVDVAPEMEYAILVSMYEVYNDRIFDLLPGPHGTSFAACRTGPPKDARRRPLLFKSTEHSPDRKVVAGLRKVLCGTAEDALMVLETALTERRVAGTGSNSVSSRSHGFFCVEVKRRPRSSIGHWSSSTLTIVDLAGSERARNAKTAGATLAEAGKINESLMYLGQCLQMQKTTDLAQPALVPFRQCKLTELLFSNSFPSFASSAHHYATSPRSPQKAVMIVTADPLGDFNATSQILRYSALAREITVPRIPSISSTIFSGTTARSQLTSGRTTPSSWTSEETEYALQEIARLGEEMDVLMFRVEEEEQRRREAEDAWRAAEARCQSIEEETRLECSAAMEKRIELEARRWRNAMGEELDRNDEHLDKKMTILSRSLYVHEDAPPTASDRLDEVERENDVLRGKIEALERELRGRSPTKNARKDDSIVIMGERSLNGDPPAKSPRKGGRATRSTAMSTMMSSPQDAMEKSIRAFGKLTLHDHSMHDHSDEATNVTTPTKSPRKALRPSATPSVTSDACESIISMDETTLRPSPSTKTPRTAGRKMR